MRLLKLEWGYLSDDCKALARDYLASGIVDVEMAVEMAIAKLGEEASFVLEEKGVS